MKEQSLAEKLRQYGAGFTCPMHMPGHKRNSPFPWMEPLAKMDITEIDGFDNLHEADGVLKEGMERMARLWGSRRSFFLVNGSTCGILAGICSLTNPGDKILMARNCHRSVYHAVELNRLRPVYLMPEADDATGILGSIRPEAVRAALEENPDIELAVLTSPTYEGVISDIASIVQVLHERGIPLLVDEAHGAHLGFSEAFSGGAVQAGADLVVQSLHKTLPSLTQTAAIHVGSILVDEDALRRQLAIFETSSPSYLLMASIDSCVRLLEEKGPELFRQYEERLKRFSEQVSCLKHLRVLGYGKDSIENHPAFWSLDKSKLVLLTEGTGLTGPAFARHLRESFRIELEMAQSNYGLAMTSICDSDQNLEQLAEALWILDGRVFPCEKKSACSTPPLLPEQAAYAWEVRNQEVWETDIEEAEGRVLAEYIWAYPPGIPLAVPGERVSGQMLSSWRKMEEAGVCLKSSTGGMAEGTILLLG
ncbi:aminotransferase class I/II-fold pyridoxal phosphate-dependent enzyme [Hominifimenecus sp. rT4P-3]|uniref:aminotransferase class I/II-fold pyridoxal phosphate-dependent enzyme n=1 Tax=Hominifimenecus sp. rT4P-3 TaxID=3242979 RepID=UPI003DA64FEB